MAHSLSAKKRIRQNLKRRLRNRANKSAMKTQIKKFDQTLLEGKDAETITKSLREAQKKIDCLAAKGVIHRHAAARKKSQLMRRMAAQKKTV
ncbi:MAG: 30S ribosomal protein S20 [Sedimentisphaerales bacterium]|nr:30S ribosomal protein S20 [Sedimentisphaerales bacterium]